MHAYALFPLGYAVIKSKVLQQLMLNDRYLFGDGWEKARKCFNYQAAFSLHFLEGARHTWLMY